MNIGLNLRNKTKLKEFVKKEIVLIISVLLALISCIISTPKLSYIDFKVIILLFNLMVVVSAFKELNVLDSIAINLLTKCKSYTSISLLLIFLTFIFSMIVTNDVALISFVPLSIIISKKSGFNPLKIIILQTLAANLGSSFTPMGNPQNLYIYSFYNLTISDFFKTMLPITLISIILLIFLTLIGKNIKLDFQLENLKIKDKKLVFIFSTLFIIIILSVFNIIGYKIAFLITLLTIFSFNKKLISKVDYSLLITFIAFFIFIGNISTLDSVKNFMEGILNNGKTTFFSSILLSQGISNVPATMLLSSFTTSSKELLLGVNIGGLGTLIASLASVISYKIYINDFPEFTNDYLRKFTFYNILSLLIIVPIIYCLSIT